MKDTTPGREWTANQSTSERLPYAKPQVLSSSGQLQAMLGTGCAVICTPANTGDPACGNVTDPVC